MTLQNAIDIRRSRRKYLTTPIDAAIVEKLQALISEYNHKAGLNMQFVLNNGSAFGGLRKSYGMFTGVMNYIGLIDNPSDEHCKEKLGYYGELLALHATMLGLGTCWVGGSFDRASCPFALSGGEVISCTITVGNVPDGLSMKEKLIHNVIHRKTKTAEEMFASDGPVPDWFMAGMRAVLRAPSAVMRQPVLFSYREGVVTAAVPDITDVGSALDFGIAKLHFEIGADGGTWDWGNGAEFHK